MVFKEARRPIQRGGAILRQLRPAPETQRQRLLPDLFGRRGLPGRARRALCVSTLPVAARWEETTYPRSA